MALRDALTAKTASDSNIVAANVDGLVISEIDAAIDAASLTGIYIIKISYEANVADGIITIKQPDETYVDVETVVLALKENGYRVSYNKRTDSGNYLLCLQVAWGQIMPKRQKNQRKKRQVCIGDMDEQIILQDRGIGEPLFGSVDFDEDFTNIATVWAAINTVSGKTFFDGVNTETNITHEFFIRFDASVSAETWVEWNSRRFDILDAENYEERSEFMKLICAERGANTIEATKA